MACNEPLWKINATADADKSTKRYCIMMKLTRRRPRTGGLSSFPRLFLSKVRKPSNNDLLDEVVAKTLSVLTRKVSFSTEALVRDTISRHEISAEEYQAAWYSQAELEGVTNSCMKQIHKITSHEVVHDDQDICIRGLETFTPRGELAKRMNRISSIQAVLNEQNRQIEEGDLDDNVIQHVYHKRSASCQIWAQTVALKDQREAEAILDDFDINSELSPFYDAFEFPTTKSSIIGFPTCSPTEQPSHRDQSFVFPAAA